MLILAIDTSSPIGSIALRDDERITGFLTASVDLTHSEGLMPAIDTLLKQTGNTIESVTHVACTSGPGSYTGLRVGIASAQGIAFARNLPCFQYTSLQVLAWAFPHTPHTICPVLPARKGWLYAQLFRWNGSEPHAVSDELYLQPDELIAHIKEPAILYGPGFLPYRDTLQGMLNDDLIEVGATAHNPRADCLAEMAFRDCLAGHSIPASALLPHYLGPSQAEVNWKKRQEKLAREQAKHQSS